jgi:hypothetical protein
VTTNELCFLILVCSAFTLLGIGLAIATIVYRRSLAAGRPVHRAVPRELGGSVVRR